MGGTGYFQGGSAGNNYLSTSTLASLATLIGGGSGDHLSANGVGDLLMAGAGNETLAGLSTVGGNIFVTGATSTSSSLVQGDAAGNDTIMLGAGASTINLEHGAASTSATSSPSRPASAAATSRSTTSYPRLT